jgi:hypothetical protein
MLKEKHLEAQSFNIRARWGKAMSGPIEDNVRHSSLGHRILRRPWAPYQGRIEARAFQYVLYANMMHVLTRTGRGSHLAIVKTGHGAVRMCGTTARG